MKKKEIESSGKLDFDKVVNNILTVAENKFQSLLRVANSRLVTLFWTVGNELNQTPYGIKSNIGLSKQLVLRFGSFFNSSNLQKMRKIAEEFPDFSFVEQIAPFVSWGHITFILKIKNPQEKLSYIKLIIEKGLTVNSLRKQVSDKVLRQYTGSRTKPSRHDISVGGMNIKGRRFLESLKPTLSTSAMENFFAYPLLSSYRRLLQPLAKTLLPSDDLIVGNDGQARARLHKLIEKFRNDQNTWLNSFLNLSFWEIGKVTYEDVSRYAGGKTNQTLIIRKASKKLREEYNRGFNERQLQQMAKFAEEFPNIEEASRIASLVCWEYIVALLPVKDIAAKFFYARLAATDKLSLFALRKQISRNIYQKRNSVKKREDISGLASVNLSQKTTTKRINRDLLVTETIYIPSEDITPSLVPNILRKPYLFLLVPLSRRKSNRSSIRLVL
jgi:predicted nuclease of restriction endonuclease-like (RecB) superfamily